MSKDNKSIKSRFLAFMLALVMIIGVMPLNVIAGQIDNGKNDVKSDVIISNKDSADARLKTEDNTNRSKHESARKCVVAFNPNGGGGSTAYNA